MKKIFALIGSLLLSACSSPPPIKLVERVDIGQFMGDWYVLAGRFTFLEKDPHNAIESYKLDPDENHISVSFHYNKGSLDGEVKSIPQRAWVYDKTSKAHWKVSPLWPLRFDFLIVALADDYSWTAIGVPDQKYLWIMARRWQNPEQTVAQVVEKLKAIGYRSDDLQIVPHSHAK